MTRCSLFRWTSKRFHPGTDLSAVLVRGTALVIALVFALLATPWASAQVLYGSINGIVTDPKDAAIPGAKVEAVEMQKGIRQEATTDGSGYYHFYSILPGVWKITVSAKGFNSAETPGILVNPNSATRIDEKLEIAKANETVTVTAAPPELQTDRADVHTDISTEELQQLPSIGSEGKSFQDLLRIVPGATLPAENNSAAGNPARAMTSNVNGMSSQGNNTRIDGILDAYPWLPNNVSYVPPSDSVQTVNVTTNSFDAEQGNVNGAAVNVQTRTGTNKFHGDGHEFHTDDQLKNPTYFQNPALFKRPINVFNQYGGAVGGPIIKDKLFFFGDYEKTWQIQAPAGGNPQTVPNLGLDYTTAIAAGYFDFAPFQNTTYNLWDKAIPASSTTPGQPAGPSHIYDPRTGNADGTGRKIISCNGVQDRICVSDLDPAAKTMASLIPAATPGYATKNTNNFLDTAKGSFQRANYDAKVSFVPGQNSSYFGKFSFSNGDIFDPPSLGPAEGNATNGGQLGNAFTKIYVIGFGATHTFTPNVLFDGNLGFTRQHLTAESTDIATNGAYGLNTLKIPGTNNAASPNDQLYWGIPAFQFSAGFTNLGNPNTGNPFVFRDNQYVGNGNLTWIKHHHEFRMGAEYTHTQMNHFQPQGASFQTARGSFKMTGTATSLVGNTSQGFTDIPTTTQYNAYADFLLGLPGETGSAIQQVDPIAIRWTTFAAYVRDQWQVTPKLSINYGIRYEFYPFSYSDHGKGSRLLDPTTMNVLIGGYGSVPENDGMKTGFGLFLPRLGAAYKLTNSTVLRLGAGMGADSNNWRFMRNDYPSVIISDNTPASATPSAPAASLTGKNAANSTVVGNPYTGLYTGIVTPVPPVLTTGVIPMAANINTGTIQNPYFRRGYIYSYNVTIEQQYKGFVIDASYVGARQIRPLINLNINPGLPGAGKAGALLNAKFATGASSLLPAGQYYATGISQLTPMMHSYYDSFQGKITRRLGHASTVGLIYTKGKAIDYEDNEELNGLMWNSPQYFARNKAVAGFDRKYNAEGYWLYDLPFGKGQRWATHGIPSALAGGWTFSGVLSRLSGTPFSVTDGNGTRQGYLNAPNNQLTPNITGKLSTTKNKPYNSSKTCTVGSINCSFFDTTAFTLADATATSPQVLGTAGRNIMRGPGFFDVDSSVFRNFKIREYLTFQFEANAYGLTNTPHFANPNADINSSSFGMVTGLASTANASLGGSGGERQWWFGGKLIF
jgi:hypothetical protein